MNIIKIFFTWLSLCFCINIKRKRRKIEPIKSVSRSRRNSQTSLSSEYSIEIIRSKDNINNILI
jgi:hypothetical protein